MNNRQVVNGQTVKFMDSNRVLRDALVTAVHGEIYYNESGEPEYYPCVNLVVVSEDMRKQDQYGMQLERETSVTHRSSNAYHEKVNGIPIGMTWQFEDEKY
ncbi:hypothetical protein [Vibrio phage Va2]|nr:hypothetical protein [Vibrio phage Va2]